MPLHDFNDVFLDPPRGVDVFTNRYPFPEGKNASEPQISVQPVGANQLSDVQGGRKPIMPEKPGTNPDYVEEYLGRGFWHLDKAMKAYWSGIRVPVKDSYRFMRVKVAGGDRGLLVWHDDLREGRVRFPVASLDRTKAEFNKEKYSPAYLPMTRRYLSRRGDLVALVYRPIPYNVSYTLSVWAQSKRDLDYITHQVMTRFNPLAEFVMRDDHIYGTVQLHLEGASDVSDKEVAAEDLQKLRYEFTIMAESWLPLPEKIVPTILGTVTTISEAVTGSILAASIGDPPLLISGE